MVGYGSYTSRYTQNRRNSGMYIFTAKLNGLDYLPPSAMTLEQYMLYQNKQSTKNYYQDKLDEQVDEAREKAVEPPAGFDPTNIKWAPKDFPIEIRTQGSAELKFGINISRTDNPVLPERQRRITTFDFNQQTLHNFKLIFSFSFSVIFSDAPVTSCSSKFKHETQVGISIHIYFLPSSSRIIFLYNYSDNAVI